MPPFVRRHDDGGGHHRRNGRRRGSCNDGVGLVLLRHGRYALDVDSEVRAGRFDLALFEQVEAVGPVLHHPAARFHVLGVVVGRTHLVWVGMRKLRVHPNLGIADLVECRRDGSTNTVAGQFVLVAHPLQGGVERVLADALLEFAAVRQQVALGGPHHPQEVAHDLDGLKGQRHDVGRYVLRPLPRFAHLVLKLLDDLRGMIQSPRSRSN